MDHLLLLLLLGCAPAANLPLYESPDGSWRIASDRPGHSVVRLYAEFREAGGPVYNDMASSGQFQLYRHIYEDEPGTYWGFGLELEPGVELLWGWEAEIRVTALCRGDTVTVASYRLLFADQGNWRGAPVPGGEVMACDVVPVLVAAGRGYFGPRRPENGNVIVVGQFPFEEPPERILRVDEVRGVSR